MADERSQRVVDKKGGRRPNEGAVRGVVGKLNNRSTEKPNGGASKAGGIESLVQQIMRAQNILVALSKNPGIDELAAALGLTMGLSGMRKNAMAVYSGEAPNSIRFLKPDDTFEKSIDGLRDFVIVLDKNKVGRVEYREEGGFVRVYVSAKEKKISEKDLEFTRGAVNVDLVVAINAKNSEDLDGMLSREGDALRGKVVANIVAGGAGGFGQIEWRDEKTSSASEMVATLLMRLQGEKKITKEVATALLTGIVAKTDKLAHDKTAPNTMSVAQKLMSAGANPISIAESMGGGLSVRGEVARAEAAVPKEEKRANAVVQKEENQANVVAQAQEVGRVNTSAQVQEEGRVDTGVRVQETGQMDASTQAQETDRLGRLDKIAEEIVNEKREERVQTEPKDEEVVDNSGDPGEVLGEGAVKAMDKIRKARIYPGDEGGEILVPDMFSGRDYEAMMENELGGDAGSGQSERGGAEVRGGAQGVQSGIGDVSRGARVGVDGGDQGGHGEIDGSDQRTQDLQTNSPTMDAVGTMGGGENPAAAAAPEVANAQEVEQVPEMDYVAQQGETGSERQVEQSPEMEQQGMDYTAQQAGLSQETGGVVNFRPEEMAPMVAPQRVAQPMSDSEVVQPWQMQVPEVPMQATQIPEEQSFEEPALEAPMQEVQAVEPQAQEVQVPEVPMPETSGVLMQEAQTLEAPVLEGQNDPNTNQVVDQGQNDPGAFRIPGM